MADPSSAVQIAGLAVSGAGTLILALVGYSVRQQDKKLDMIVTQVADVAEKVSDHAARLAEGRATMDALKTTTANLEDEVKRLVREGCAHRLGCFGGNGHRGGPNGGEG